MDANYTGTQIAARRKALGLTQKELAAKLHITDKAVSKWERGINFPDLGIMEALAQALETTPVCLLGLEHADQNEIVTSMAEVSQEQLEDAQRDHSRTGWGCLVIAIALVLAYQLFGGKDVVSKQRAYQLLHCVITVVAVYGIYLLFKYAQIRKFEFADYWILYSAVLAEIIRLGYMFLTGYSPPDWLTLLCLGISFCCIQWLFLRIMKPKPVKMLPVICTVVFALWHMADGRIPFLFLFPALCCIAVCIRLRKKLRP